MKVSTNPKGGSRSGRMKYRRQLHIVPGQANQQALRSAIAGWLVPTLVSAFLAEHPVCAAKNTVNAEMLTSGPLVKEARR